MLRHLAAILPVVAGQAVHAADQDLTINSIPEGAACEVVYLGKPVARLESTPGTVLIERERDEIVVTCRLNGYRDTSTTLDPVHPGVGQALRGSAYLPAYEDFVILVLEPVSGSGN